MKKVLVVFVLSSLFFVSCNKIVPEKKISNPQEKSKESINVLKKEEIQDGIDLNNNRGVNLEEETLITERFNTISSQYSEYGEFIRSNQYKDFVQYVYEVFDKYKKLDGNNEKELTYIFEVLIPKIVVNNWVVNGKISDEESELMIQSIKRKEFNSLEQKKLLTERFKIYLEEKSFNPFIKKLTPEKISEYKKNNSLFIKDLLNEDSGIIYSVLKNRYDWNKTGIGYKPSDLEGAFADYLNKKMLSVFSIFGFSDNQIQDLIFKELKINKLEDLAVLINNDYKYIIDKYNLYGKVPTDREYRNDEQNDIFQNRATVDKYIYNISDGKNNEFESDLKKLRLKMYLISYFGKDRKDLDPDQGLWSSRARAKFINDKDGDGIQNLFRLSRYIKGEEVVIDFNNILN